MKTSVIFLAGGVGARMGGDIPKQFLTVRGKTIASLSLDVFLSMPQACVEVIVVCQEQYEHYFCDDVIFARPGKLRQESVFNGLQKVSKDADFVCIHDSARPNIDNGIVLRTLEAAKQYGAAVAGVSIDYTIKEVDGECFVKQTLDRSKIWEIQTPQIIRYDLLCEGFDKVNRENIIVTDDVSIVEFLEKPVKVVEGSRKNIKITTPEDLQYV
jgi:2-C-methyl-D-erythritol 4-phosphate cytidylyltransferase